MIVINDNVWGHITIEDKYVEVINCKEFQAARDKLQLGFNFKTKHTRFEHMLGAFYVSGVLIEILLQKFSRMFCITEEDIEAIRIAALLHDIGHTCFSHCSEPNLEGTHEENTLRIILDETSEVHQTILRVFGEKVLQKIIYLLTEKENANNPAMIIMFIIKKLLAGGIDVDRVDFIRRDSYYLFGEKNDFTGIFKSIDLDFVNGTLEVDFLYEAMYSIINLFYKRMELYDREFYNNYSKLLENVYARFLELSGVNLTWSTSEEEMNSNFVRFLESSNEVLKRYAFLLLDLTSRKDIVIKEVNSKDESDRFKANLFREFPELVRYSEAVYQNYAKIVLYKKGNKILIKKDGIIKDITEWTPLLNEYAKEKFILGVDLFLLRRLMELDRVPEEVILKTILRINSVFNGNLDQEKKYIFMGDTPQEEFKRIRNSFNLGRPQFQKYTDMYYEDKDGILKSRGIIIRKRTLQDREVWLLKSTINDNSSVHKSYKNEFNSLEEVLAFGQKDIGLKISDLFPTYEIRVYRAQYNFQYKGGTYEVSFDKMIPVVGDSSYEADYMMEWKLKEGSSAGLYFINEILKDYQVMETDLSKKEIAYNRINNNNSRDTYSGFQEFILSLKPND